MKTKQMALGMLLAVIGLLVVIGVAAAAGGASPQAQDSAAATSTPTPALTTPPTPKPSIHEEQRTGASRLGVLVADVTTGTTAHFNLAVTSGAVVLQVLPNTPAQAAGLHAGDVIQSVNGQSVVNAGAMVNAIKALTPGSSVTLGVARGSQTLTLSVTLTQKPKPQPEPRQSALPLPGYLKDLGSLLTNGNILHGDLQVMGANGAVTDVAFTIGKVSSATDTTLTIMEKNSQWVSFTATSDTKVIVDGHLINLSGLKPNTPVIVLQENGAVTVVLAWPGDYEKPGNGPKPLNIRPITPMPPPVPHKALPTPPVKSDGKESGKGIITAPGLTFQQQLQQQRGQQMKQAQEHAKQLQQQTKHQNGNA